MSICSMPVYRFKNQKHRFYFKDSKLYAHVGYNCQRSMPIARENCVQFLFDEGKQEMKVFRDLQIFTQAGNITSIILRSDWPKAWSCVKFLFLVSAQLPKQISGTVHCI